MNSSHSPRRLKGLYYNSDGIVAAGSISALMANGNNALELDAHITVNDVGTVFASLLSFLAIGVLTKPFCNTFISYSYTWV